MVAKRVCFTRVNLFDIPYTTIPGSIVYSTAVALDVDWYK